MITPLAGGPSFFRAVIDVRHAQVTLMRGSVCHSIHVDDAGWRGNIYVVPTLKVAIPTRWLRVDSLYLRVPIASRT